MDVWAKEILWSLDHAQIGDKCGLQVLPSGTREWGKDVLALEGLVWGWTPPGDLRAADEYGLRLAADVELKQWNGSEVEQAKALAARVGGVTSHGFGGGAKLRPVLAEFAAAGRLAFPQVYDSDRKRDPAAFLRQCVEAYGKAGFPPERVIPLLGIVAGADYVREWRDEAHRLGCPAVHYWSLQRGCQNIINSRIDIGPPEVVDDHQLLFLALGLGLTWVLRRLR